MNKKKQTIPSKTKQAVLKEFNDRCAMCGAHKPHIHHIDRLPDNNSAVNLIPLCPNCHLTDQHNPTAMPDPKRLSLFRIHKDPSILHEKFQPIWKRCQFLLDLDSYTDAGDVRKLVGELIEFVAHLQMGGFYSHRLEELIGLPVDPALSNENLPRHVVRQAENVELILYRNKVANTRDRALSLIVEMLRYQDWGKKIS